MAKIIGTGSLIIDLTGYAPHLPVDGETSLGSSIKIGPGGKGGNQINAASRAGAEAVIISAMGNDFLSGVIKDHYKNEGLSTEYIKIIDGAETGSAIIEVNEETAQNRIIVVKGANDLITKEDVLKAEKDFADCDAVLTQLETSMESVICCKSLAKKYHKPFILNPAPFQKLPEGIIDSDIDYITPNETEAEFFTGVHIENADDAKRAAEILLAKGVKNVIITLGKQGVFYTDGKRDIKLDSIKVNAVDTTGAGDAFNGGFAAAIAMGLEIETALKFANCTGALSVTKYGTSPAMPKKEEIFALLKKEYGIDLEK